MIKTISSPSGSLTVVEFSEFRFEVARIFYIYNVSPGDQRGGHAHKSCKEYVLALSGSCDIAFANKYGSGTVTLSDPTNGYYVEPGTWIDLFNFTAGTVLLVLCSEGYDEEDYIRDFDQFNIFISTQS